MPTWRVGIYLGGAGWAAGPMAAVVRRREARSRARVAGLAAWLASVLANAQYRSQPGPVQLPAPYPEGCAYSDVTCGLVVRVGRQLGTLRPCRLSGGRPGALKLL